MNEGLIKYLNESLSRDKERSVLYIDGVNVYFVGDRTKRINFPEAIKKALSLVPDHLRTEFDYIQVGEIPEFKERQINALTMNGVIYITGQQSDQQDIIDDIVHEIAHTLEEKYGYEIYADGKMEREFITKRTTLMNRMSSHGIECDESLFLDAEYSKSFDEFLYTEVGYPTLVSLSMDLFMTPYGVTSIREYWAEGFERYFMGDSSSLKKTCPTLYLKIEGIAEND